MNFLLITTNGNDAYSTPLDHLLARTRSGATAPSIVGFRTVAVVGQSVAGGGVVGYDVVALSNTTDGPPSPLGRLQVLERGLGHVGGESAAAAHVVGRFAINVASFEGTALAPLKTLLAAAPPPMPTLVVVDELGAMQLESTALAPTVLALCNSPHFIVVCTARRDPGSGAFSTAVVRALAARSDVESIEVTRGSADGVGPLLWGKIAPLLRGGGGDLVAAAVAGGDESGEERRKCTICKKKLVRDAFSRSQWDRADPARSSKKQAKCASCVVAAEAKEAAANAKKRGGGTARRTAARAGVSKKHLAAVDALRAATAATAAEAEATTGLRAARGSQIKRGGKRWSRGRGRGRGRGRR